MFLDCITFREVELVLGRRGKGFINFRAPELVGYSCRISFFMWVASTAQPKVKKMLMISLPDINYKI